MEINLFPDKWEFRDEKGRVYSAGEIKTYLYFGWVTKYNHYFAMWVNSNFDLEYVKSAHKDTLQNIHTIIKRAKRPQDIVHAMSWIENLRQVSDDLREHKDDTSQQALLNNWMARLRVELEKWHREVHK